MKNNLLALMVALSLGSGSALAAINVYTIAPGATLSPADNESAVYEGTINKMGGSFTDSYDIDFTNYTHNDVWTFQLLSYGLKWKSVVMAPGLSGLSMSLYDNVGANLWTMPVTTVTTTQGSFVVETMSASSYGVYSPGRYRLDVTGSGPGVYSITATIPEPETWAIFLTGIALLGLRLRNRQNMLG